MTAKPSPVGAQVGIQPVAWLVQSSETSKWCTTARYEMEIWEKKGKPITPLVPAAVLNRVCEMLEAKAKEWDNWADMHLDGEALAVANKCHFDLLALASTLGETK